MIRFFCGSLPAVSVETEEDEVEVVDEAEEVSYEGVLRFPDSVEAFAPMGIGEKMWEGEWGSLFV